MPIAEADRDKALNVRKELKLLHAPTFDLVIFVLFDVVTLFVY